VRMGSSINMV